MTGDELRAMPNWAWSEIGNAEQDELAAALDDRDTLDWLLEGFDFSAARIRTLADGKQTIQYANSRADLNSARGKS